MPEGGGAGHRRALSGRRRGAPPPSTTDCYRRAPGVLTGGSPDVGGQPDHGRPSTVYVAVAAGWPSTSSVRVWVPGVVLAITSAK